MKLKKEGVARSWMFICVAILYSVEVVDAITDPRLFTTKPPIHREAVLPWYLNDEDLPPPEKYLAPDSSDEARNSGQKKSINYVIEAEFGHPPSNPSFEETTNDDSDIDDNVGTKNVHRGNKNNLYEGISTSSKKPTMVKIVVPMAPSQVNTVARYDKRSGVAQCPNSKATGHFVYPPDCKFFVNCHQGRAYVEPCAPGTLFNPDSLECDFPNKVKCRDERKIDYPNSDYTSGPRRQFIQRKQEIKCPPGHTGMLPHPETCTKFLQCLDGGTFIMDCGPGTAFNPKISVCDWPYNVPACSKNPSLQSSGQNNHGNNDRYGSSGGTTDHGQRPYQYENHQGNSGTRDGRNRWNGEQPPDRIIYPDEYSGHDQIGSADGRYDGHAHNHEQRPRQHEDNGGTFNVPPRPLNWNKPGNPEGTAPVNGGQYDQSKWFDKGVRQYDNPDESQTIGQWNTQGYVNGNANRPRDRQLEYDRSNNKQWTSEQAQNPENNEFIGESSYNRRHYVNVQNGYNHGDPASWSNEGEHQHSEDDGQESSQTSSNNWSGYHHNHDHGDGQHQNHHHHHQGHDHRYHSGHWQEAEGSKSDGPGPNYPTNDRTGYGRTNTDFSNPQPNGAFTPNENNDRRYGWKPAITITTPRPIDDEYYPSKPVWDRKVIHISNNREMRPSQPEKTGSESGGFVPSPWRGRQFDGNQGSPPTSDVSPQDEWNQDTLQFPVYYVAPVHPLGHTPKPAQKTPSSGQILRLRGGSSPRDGYLEAQGVHPGWGVVCDSKNGWSLKEAHVVCRQLGYTRGAEMAWQGRIQSDKTEVPWIATTHVDCKGNESQFQLCKFVHGQECLVKRDAVGVRCMANRLAHCRDDELAHDGQCYHLANPDSGLNHAEALEYCSSRKAQLVDVTSQAENNFLSEWLMHYYPNVNSVMTSGIGFTTFNKTLWLWEDSARAKFQFNKWWPGWMNDKKLPPWPGSRPVCVVMKKQFPCHDKPEAHCPTDYFFWDVEDCATSMKGHSYVCERPYDDIGCVYGKGQLYEGSANVSASGKKCLPWNDPTLIHPLRVNVVNPEVKEKLMTHNYCRNPNPMKESRPWCFIGLYGEREYCDIPPCGEIGMKRSPTGGKCKPKHFECMPGECIPSPWVCDGEEDCTNGIDEVACSSHLGFFKKNKDHRLDGHDVEKWLNTPAKTCALRCKEADFTCRSFSHKSKENLCLLSDTNVGLSGDLLFDVEYDYYEMIDRTINCNGMFVCGNDKCINRTQVCDGKNDCGDRSDENICTVEKLDYEIRLAGSNNTYEGRVEVKVLGHWGQVCDDGFGMNDANVVCKELGFELGALEINPGGFFGNMDPPERFMVDQLKCRGNETSIRECDFDGWGVHNCRPEEAVGVVCKSAVNTCQLGHWKCDTSPTCIPTTFICDDVEDCPDKSDENAAHCMAPFELRLANGSSPLEGRVEVRHHGVWGTVCDDDFTHSAAKVICRALGYGGQAVAKKNGYFGPGDGPIWLDEVFCHGNETQLSKCEHNPWGRHNCDHDEDAGVICTEGSIDDSQFDINEEGSAEFNISELLPSDCGRRPEDFSNGDDGIFQRVVRGSIAPKGSYPWQASLRIRGHSRSSHWCGAVILSPLHVLTAAHCLEGYNKGAYFIRAGDYHSEIDEGTEVEANIEDYFIHEDFRKGQRMNNDIALVLLKGRGIPLGEHIMPICLPPKNAEYSPGLNCTISGFGSVENGQSAQSLNLRYGWVPLLDQSVCRADYVYGREKISEGMICAGFLDEGVDACDGDSGGPLACQSNGAFTLYGVTSWGHHCGEPNKPGVYVRVAYYRDWIDQKIHESLFGR